MHRIASLPSSNFGSCRAQVVQMDGNVHIQRAVNLSSLIPSHRGSKIVFKGIIGPLCSVRTNPKRQCAL